MNKKLLVIALNSGLALSTPCLAQQNSAPAKPSTAPAAQPAPAATAAQPAPPAAQAAPVGLQAAPPKAPAQAKAPAKPGAQTAAPVKLDRAEAIKRANAFFNASPVMTADFVQLGADGKRSEGKLHVQRAGRVRFEYAEPATMEVVSDGARVVVRDRKLKSEQAYFIDQTPLKFFMKEKFDLEKDVKVVDVVIEDSGVTIEIEDSATFGGTSHVKLLFDPKSFKLKQWQVTDPQGYQTLLTLFNVDQTTTPDPALFKIDQKSSAN
ncbi:MAG: outer-membrane lipoprotein carrier protein LolA [Methylocystis sp.]